MLDKLFANVAAASAYTSSGFITNLQQNQVGTFWDNLRRSNTYATNREANFPLDFFVPSPYANAANIVSNNSWSYFHDVEVELNRRFSSGLTMLTNYTFSKVLTDTTFLNNQTENQNYRSIKNPKLDKARAGFDVRQSFSATFLYPLPVGRGKPFLGSAPGIVNALVGGWMVNSLTRWSTGSPFTLLSGRFTTGSLVGESAVIRNMTANDIKKNLGVFREGSGVYWINPQSGLVNIVSAGSSRAVMCTAGQTTPCFDHPGAGEFGNMPFNGLSLPGFFDQDFGLSKRTKFLEKYDFEIRLEMFNAFNNPSFTTSLTATVPTTSIDSTTFGRLTTTVDTARGGGINSRIIQFGAKFNW
jgi:hypothetical protein